MEKLPILVVFSALLLVPVGMDNAFADTLKATFFDPNAALDTPNPLANNDPKTNDWLDVANPLTVTNLFSNNIDATEPGGIGTPDQTVGIFIQSGTIGIASLCVGDGNLCVTYNVVRGFEEGSFTFSGLPPNVPVQVTVIISDMDHRGVTLDAAGTMPAEETVFVTGNGVDLGTVTPNGVIGNDQVLTKTFTTLAQSDGSGGLIIGFNQVFREFVSTPTTLPQSFFDVQFGIRVEQIALDFDSTDRVVGGELLPIETTSLLLAGVQSFSWMIPVVLSVLGIGLFVVSRKSK